MKAITRAGGALFAFLLSFCLGGMPGLVAAQPPIYLGLDLEIGDLTSTSDDAVRLGATVAIEEINQRGGVLGGQKLELMVTDNRSMPARGAQNLKKLAAVPGMVAVMTGKFSPVVLDQVKELPALHMVLLDPWAAADGIIANGQKPNWAFRLSLSDTLAVKSMVIAAKKRGYRRLGVMLPNIAWGRSNHAALEGVMKDKRDQQVVGVSWYNWGGISTQDMLDQYQKLRLAGAQVIYLVANEREGEQFVNLLASLPAEERLPVLSHWGVTGGDFFRMAGDSLNKIDFSVIQTYSFAKSRNARARRLAEQAMAHFSVDDPAKIPSAVGIAHAYDLVHVLAMAIEQAGSASPEAVRKALEHLPAYDGVVKHFAPVFTVDRHEALSERDPYFARYRADGGLLRDTRY